MTAVDLECPIHSDLAIRAMVAGEELPPPFASCAECAERLSTLRGLRDLGRGLDWAAPDAARSARVRARMLDAVVPSSGAPAQRLFQRFRAVWSIFALSAAAAAVVVVAARRGKDDRVRVPSSEISLGNVRPIGAARFDRVSQAPDEVVRLVDGRIHVEVADLGPAQRFRIVTDDAVVEVRGTAFDVQASGAGLREVSVERGRVEVRMGANPPRIVAEGSHWAVGEVVVDAPREPAPARAPFPVPAPSPPPAPAVAHPARERAERLVNVPPPEQPVVATDSPAGQSAPVALPAAEVQTRGSVPAPTESKKTPVLAPKPTVTVPTAATPELESETVRRERDDRRAERRELREERRLERLERRR